MKRTKLASGVAFALCSAASLIAQEAARAQAQEEVIVTAQRREQNLQEVPISMVAITGDGLLTRGLESLEDLNSTIPNLIMMGDYGGDGTAQSSFRVRGIPGVGTYVDGIWQVSQRGMLTQEFVDIERIEVLRGPQGTLFGRDSVGGAIRIWTRRPAEEFESSVKLTAGTQNRRDATVSVDVPLSDTVLSKWTFASLNRDGFLDNITTGGKNGGIDQTVLRGDITFTPTDRLDFRFNLQSNESEYLEARVQHGVWTEPENLLFPTSLAPLYTAAGLPYTRETQMAGWPGGELGEWQTRTQQAIPNRIDTDQLSMNLDWDLTDNVALNFLTGYVEQDVRIFIDFDNSQYGLVEDLDMHNLEMFSQEIQISGSNGPFEWVGGLFYWDQTQMLREMRFAAEEFNADPSLEATMLASQYCQDLAALGIPDTDNGGPPANDCANGLAFFSGFAWTGLHDGLGGNLQRQEQDGWAIFGEATVALTDQLDFTFGLRHHDQDILTDSMIPTSQGPQFTNQTYATDPFQGVSIGDFAATSFDETTARLSLQYQFDADLMAYASFSQGFNAGGAEFFPHPVNGDEIIFNSWVPETVENLEVGLRSDFVDGRVRFNATLFMMDWDDIQAEATYRIAPGLDAPGLHWQNIGKGEVKGAEFELTVLPADNLTVNFNLGLLDTKLTDAFLGDLAGWVPGEFEFSQAPETTANIGFQHDAQLANGGTFITRFDYSYSDQYWRSFDPTLRTVFAGAAQGYDNESGDFGYLNARLTYRPQSANYEFSVFGTNLTDEYVLNSGFMHKIWGFDFATVAPPRQAGVTMQVFF